MTHAAFLKPPNSLNMDMSPLDSKEAKQSFSKLQLHGKAEKIALVTKAAVRVCAPGLDPTCTSHPSCHKGAAAPPVGRVNIAGAESVQGLRGCRG